MNTKKILLLAAISIVAVSCSVEPEVYTLDVTKSNLAWHGEENEEHFHDGTISFTKGSITMRGDEMISGEFKLDPSTINPTTEGLPEEKKAYLAEHLMDTSLLFVAQYPEITVTTGAFIDGKLAATINVRGVDIKTEVPLKMNKTEQSISLTGEFTVDLLDAMMPYLTTPKEKTGKPGAKSGIKFKMSLLLEK